MLREELVTGEVEWVCPDCDITFAEEDDFTQTIEEIGIIDYKEEDE